MMVAAASRHAVGAARGVGGRGAWLCEQQQCAATAARTLGLRGSSTAQPGRPAHGGQPSTPTRARAEHSTRQRRAPGTGDRAQPGKQPEVHAKHEF